MFEAKVLAAFIASRKDYDMVQPHVDRSSLAPLSNALLEAIDSYYANDISAESIDLDILQRALDRRFKDIPKHKERMRDFMEEVLSTDSSKVNAVYEVIQHKRAIVGTNLADALLNQDDEDIELYLQEYRELTDTTVLESSAGEEYVGTTLDQLEELFGDKGTWKLSPRELGKRIKGDLRAGHSVFMAARPERGKTLVAINATGGFLSQGAKVLYIGNEDPIPDLVLRLLSNLSGMTEDEMYANKEEAMERAVECGYNNCVFVGLSPGTLYEVEAMVRRHEPDILIVDQMRNLKASTENNTQRLDLIAQELRNIARRNGCVVLPMTQVGDSGRDKLILNDGDIDGSNTGIPGACDVMVMIGSNEDYDRRNLRRFTLVKNKRGGDHSDFTVSIEPELSRVRSYA